MVHLPSEALNKIIESLYESCVVVTHNSGDLNKLSGYIFKNEQLA